MKIDDMVLVSVDDHVVEPPAPLRGPAAREVRGPRAEVHHPRRRHQRVGLRGPGDRRTSRSTPSPAARRRSTAWSRPRSPSCGAGCYDIDERVKDMDANGVLGSLCFPSFPQFCGQLLRPHRGQGRRAGDDAGLQRLAHRGVVRHAPRPLHPVLAPGDLGSRGAGRRGAAHRRARAPTRSRSRRTRRSSGWPELPLRPLGPVLDRRAATRTSSCACTSARRRSS